MIAVFLLARLRAGSAEPHSLAPPMDFPVLEMATLRGSPRAAVAWGQQAGEGSQLTS